MILQTRDCIGKIGPLFFPSTYLMSSMCPKGTYLEYQFLVTAWEMCGMYYIFTLCTVYIMVLHRNLILVETLIFFYPIPIYPLGAFVLTLRQYFFMHLYSYMVAGLKEFAN